MIPRSLARKTCSTNNDPSLNIPNELLIKIFKSCASGPIIIPGSCDSTDFSWVLCIVCRRWRSIAKEVPELWTNIYMNYGRTSAISYSDTIIDIARRVLSRSKKNLVSLKIEHDIPTNGQRALTQLVRENAHQFQHLEIKMLGIAIQQIFNSTLPIFNHLEFLSIQGYDHSLRDLLSPFNNASALKVLEVKIRCNWLAVTPYVSWDHLEHLSIIGAQGVSPTITVGVILCFPRLVTLQVVLKVGGEHEENPDLAPLSTFLLMKTLIVEACGFIEINDFLRRLELPALTRLELRSQYGGDFGRGDFGRRYWVNPPLQLIIPRFPRVEYLKIAFPVSQDQNLRPFLQTMSNVVEFTFPLLSHSTLILLAFNPLLPKLKTLRINIPSESLSAHLWMLNKRAQSNPELPHLLLYRLSDHPVESIDNGSSDNGVNIAPGQVVRVYEVHAQMRDFVPSYLKPQW